MEVEGVVYIAAIDRQQCVRHKKSAFMTRTADTPGYCTLLTGGRGLVGLAFNAQVHDMIAADGAVVHHDVYKAKDTVSSLIYMQFAGLESSLKLR